MAGTVTMDLNEYDSLRKCADQFTALASEQLYALYNEALRRFPDVEDHDAQTAQINARRKFHDEHEAVIRVLVVPKDPK